MGSSTSRPHALVMTTLHLQVPINDISEWKAAFADHAEARRNGGVRNTLVRHPVDDETLLLVDLDFDSVPAAEGFLRYLQNEVWKDQPILAGAPSATILEAVALP
jgi:hypothetical protein